jgi:hypothetical protein
MGRQPLQSAATVSVVDWFRTYTAHKDPAAAVANLVAVVVALNGPFYPLYVVYYAGPGVLWPALLTMVASPFFLAIPLLTRRSSRIGRLALPIIGTINTIWCLQLLGPETEVGLFLLPCIALAALLFRPDERFLLLLAATVPFVALFLPDHMGGAPLISFTTTAAERLAAVNITSIRALIFLLALRFAGLFQSLAIGRSQAAVGDSPSHQESNR